jgi:hypothetical protein
MKYVMSWTKALTVFIFLSESAKENISPHIVWHDNKLVDTQNITINSLLRELLQYWQLSQSKE